MPPPSTPAFVPLKEPKPSPAAGPPGQGAPGGVRIAAARAFAVMSGDVRLAGRIWERPGCPVVVLVHGYPDNSHVWDGVAACLSSAFEVVVYDVRGAGASGAPAGRDGYRLQCLADDFIAVLDAVSPQGPVHLVGHDWGSIQSWEFVTDARLRGRIASFTSCSGPCLDHVSLALREQAGRPTPGALLASLRQLMASWYILFFHLPWLPEWNWRTWLGRHWSRYLRLSERVEVGASPTQAEDGCRGVALYRANFLPRLRAPRQRYAHAPVQLIVPTLDRYVRPALFDKLPRWVPSLWRREVEARHWLPLSDPAGMAAMVHEFVEHIEGAEASAALLAAHVQRAA